MFGGPSLLIWNSGVICGFRFDLIASVANLLLFCLDLLFGFVLFNIGRFLFAGLFCLGFEFPGFLFTCVLCVSDLGLLLWI